MKKLLIPFIAFITIACNSGNMEQDSVEMAKEVNESLDSASGNAADSIAADKDFMVEATSGSLMEIQLGKYAAANAASPAVKEFGQMMVADHTKADSLLTVIATARHIAIPNVPGEDHQKHIDELTAKKGAAFDKAYMDMMVKDHEEDVKKFEDAAKNAKDGDVKEFAATIIPVLKKHLDAAKKIREELK